jgi:hypothetical protein
VLVPFRARPHVMVKRKGPTFPIAIHTPSAPLESLMEDALDDLLVKSFQCSVEAA